MATTIRSLFTRYKSTTAKVPSPDFVEVLFPTPTRFPPSVLSPHALPGTSPEAEKALLEILRHNHQNNHIFFNDKRYHNHVVHHILAIYAMGANGELLNEGYKNDDYQRPLGKSPAPISDDNLIDHLGDPQYYQAYLEFFSNKLISDGVDKTLEDYLYSKNINFIDNADEAGTRQPEMFGRFMSGLMHPLIHTGYGLEFGLLGILAEALAQSAVHNPTVSTLVPKSYFDETFYSNAVSAVVSGVSTLLRSTSSKSFTSDTPQSRDSEVPVFDVLALVLRDESLAVASTGVLESESPLSLVLETKADTIRKYSEMWSLDVVGSSNPDQEIHRKIEELAWATAVIYGVSGWHQGPPFRADFVLMHLVTSSLFLPSICAYFPPHVIQIFLRSYFSVCLATWVGQGRPTIEITPDFVNKTDASPQEPIGDRVTKPAKGTLAPETITPNPWLAIIQSALVHPDDHVCKIQRALGHWGRMFGGRPLGYWTKSSPKKDTVQLEGIELLDGTLFARVAGMTQAAKGWMREGQERGGWSLE